MIKRIPPAFAGMPAFYIDTEGSPLVNNRGHLATDRDFNTSEVETELDRITLEMCAYHRGRGEILEPWQLQAELKAFKRTRARAA